MAPALAAPCAAPSWWIAFHRHGLSRLEAGELEEEILREAADAGWKAPARSAAARDASCFIRMYGTPSADGPLTARNIEDAIRSPFAALTLLTLQPDTNDPPGRPGAPGHRAWRLPGAVRSRPGYGPDPRIIAYACLDYAARDDRARSVAISRLAHEPGSPGRAFRLSTEQITDALVQVAESHPQIAVACSTGEDTLMIRSGPLALAGDLLANRYGCGPPALPLPRRRPARRAPRSAPPPGQASLW